MERVVRSSPNPDPQPGMTVEQDVKGGEAGSHMDIWERTFQKERHVQRPWGRCLSDGVEAQQGGLVSRG